MLRALKNIWSLWSRNQHVKIYLKKNRLICPSCLIFGASKGHMVCEIVDASKMLRNKLDEVARDGLLKFEISENVLLDMRHTKLTCEEKK